VLGLEITLSYIQTHKRVSSLGIGDGKEKEKDWVQPSYIELEIGLRLTLSS
jgi:hypothetical protein